MKFILTKDDPLASFENRGGGKAANLAYMSRHDAPVPAWFCITADAFDEFVEQNGLHSRLVPENHLEQLDEFAKEIEKLFLSFPLPVDVQQEIDRQLETMRLDQDLCAVRSSGIDEDSAGHSFAGLFSSFLCQRGNEAVSESIRRCWASGFSERAIAYRVERGLNVSGIRVGVVIQSMIEPAAAGVAFSRNPLRPLDRSHLVIESVFGLGEGLVSGEVDADYFELRRVDLAIDEKVLANKETAVRFARDGGIVSEPLDLAMRSQASLNNIQICELGALVLKLEHNYGVPQDIEWAFDKSGTLHVVQARPITTLPVQQFFDAAINGHEVTLWDNSNIIESYSGVTSPLTFSFANEAYRKVYVQFCEVMGVPQSEIDAHDSMYRNMLGLIRGRIYYNLINWYRLIQMLPLAGNSGEFMETMMGVRQELKPELVSLFDFMQNPPRYTLARKLLVTALSAWRFMRIDTIVNDFHRRFDNIYNDACEKNFRAMSLPALADYYQLLDEEVLANWRAPIINDYLCMIFFGLLKKLTERWVAGSDEAMSLQNDLLCGQGGLESTEPTKLLMAIAQWINGQDQDLKDWLDATPADEAWHELSDEGRWPELFQRIDDYLDKYGFRCINELKLEEKDLHEDPSFIINAIRSYVRAGTFDVAALESREAAIRDNAEATVQAQLGGLRKIAYGWVLKHARKAVRNRENLRFARTKIFGICRRIFRAMGDRLHQLSAIDHERDVFLLTVEDLMGFIEGRPTTADLRSLVAIRKKEFDSYRRTPSPPDRLITYGAAGVSFELPQVLADADLLRSEASLSGNPNVLTGTPCCPGVVEGTVLVAESASDAEGLDQEILVTARTDPGWVPLYPSCAGLLIERGSLLSHSAVVARELGLPTIVGISGGLMTKLKTGQRVRIDAGRGEVEILS